MYAGLPTGMPYDKWWLTFGRDAGLPYHPPSGHKMYRLGENGMLFSSADPSAESLQASAMATVLPGQDIPAGPECDCPPPTVIYKDRIITKIVDRPVPGPTQIVYVDRYITQPDSMPSMVESDDSASDLVFPVNRIPAASAPLEGSEMSEGEESAVVIQSTKKFPWLLVAIGGAAVYMLSNRKKSKA